MFQLVRTEFAILTPTKFVTAESIDNSLIFGALRYSKGESDYLNCLMQSGQYQSFIEVVQQAEKVELHQFEDTRPFDGCLPIELMVERGPDSIRLSPMKPVGLDHPKTGERYHAVVQLRQENSVSTLYYLVGFQTIMIWTTQRKYLC